MNYYGWNLSDWSCQTAHLSLVEIGAFRVLVDFYLNSERPISASQAHRIARAHSAEERLAVDAVLADLFVLDGENWRNAKLDALIEANRVQQARIADLRKREAYRQHRETVLALHGNFCTYCGADDVPLQLDHVVPRCRGGSDDISNLVPACRPCNASKGGKLLSEWAPQP